MNPFPTPRGYEPELRKQTERANRLEGELTATKYEVERLEVDLLGERQHVQLHVQRLNPGLCAKYNSPETTPAQWRCLCATVVAEADLERAALRAELDVRLEQIRKKDDELDYLTRSNNALREDREKLNLVKRNCHIAYYPDGNAYPLEHAPFAGKNQFEAICTALATKNNTP